MSRFVITLLRWLGAFLGCCPPNVAGE